MNMKIYTMTHRQFSPPADEIYVPLHVGRALAADMGYPGDDTGDNISDLNEFYGELTGIYWVWKNDCDSDVVGVCHYRRYFLNDGGGLMTQADYERILQDYDVLVSDLPSAGGTNYDNFAKAHSRKDLDLTAAAIKALYPLDYAVYEAVMQENKCCYGNLMVCKKELFDAYCAWLFPIFVEMGDKINVSSYDMYHKRLFGFLSEMLLYVWIKARGLKYCAGKIGVTAEKAESVEFKNAIVQLMQQGEIDQAKELFYGYLKLRPDIRENISDIRGEIPVLEQLLYIMHQERKAGVDGLLAFTNQIPVLMEHYKNVCNLVRDHGDAVREGGAAYLREFPISDVALAVIKKQLSGTLSYYEYLNEGKPPKKVSVIVPVYNGVGSFEGCIGNLVHQNLEDIEIIFVDDCSKDSSLAVLYECQRQFPDKVRVIASPENRRAGGARNLGLDAATGEYIGFVDCDDLPDVEMYELLYARAKEGDYDIVDGGFLYDKQEKLTLYTTDDLTGRLDGRKRHKLIKTGGYLWSKLFRRELIESHHLRFREHVVMLEDSDFLDYLFAVADSIGNEHQVIYRYKNTEGSLSKHLEREIYWDSLQNAMEATYEKLNKLKVYKKIQTAVEFEMLQWYSCAVNSCVESYLAKEPYDFLNKLYSFRKTKKNTIKKIQYNDPDIMDAFPLADRVLMELNDSDPKHLLEAADVMKWEFNTH